MRVNEIRVIGRNTQGVRLIDLEEGERVGAVARLAEREDEADVPEASSTEAPGSGANGESSAEPDVEPDPDPTES
jgi:DNA gyrase subunit A